MTDKGFQLIEAALVMGGIALLSTIAWRGLTDMTQNYRLHAAGQILMGTATMARSAAITRNARIELNVHPDGTQVATSGGESPEVWRPLPRDVRVITAPKSPITFHSRGIAAPAGSLVVENPSGRLRVVVSPSGRVRWQRD